MLREAGRRPAAPGRATVAGELQWGRADGGRRESRVDIKLHKPGVPSGQISLTDVGAIARAVQESVQALVQWELGLDPKVRPTREVMDLSEVLLTQVGKGSTTLMFEPAMAVLPANHQQPVAIALQRLYTALQACAANERWPASVPPEIKQTLSQRLRPVLTSGGRIEIGDPTGGSAPCILDEAGRRRLQRREPYQGRQQVAVCGEVVELDRARHSFEVKTPRGRTRITATPERWAEVDDPLRWRRVVAVGWPGDAHARTIGSLTALREAAADDADRIEWLTEPTPDSQTHAAIRQRLDALAALQQDWDTYGAPPIDRRSLEAAESLTLRGARALERHGRALPSPFIAPTTQGTVQLEWQVEARALEVEVFTGDRYGYYLADSTANLEDEAECGSWSACRLLQWLVSGERP